MALGEKYVISQYSFEEGTGTTVNDTVRQNHGVMSGGTYANGKVGRYSVFFNLSGMVDLASGGTSIYGLSKDDQFSIELWINIPSTTLLPAGGVGLWEIALNNNRGISLGFQDYNIYVKPSGNFQLPLISTTPVSTDAWHHIVTTYNGGEVNVYVDKNLNLSGSLNLISQSNLNTKIGNEDMYSNISFYGYIDEVKIWKGIMNANDIVGAYNGGYGTPYVARRNEITVNDLATKFEGRTSFGLAMVQ